MNAQQMKIQEAIATLVEAGYAVNVWTDEDILQVLEDTICQYKLDPKVFEEKREEVVKRVKESPEWEALEEANEWDWYMISSAVEEALELY